MNLIRIIPLLTIVAGLLGWILTFSVNQYSSPFATAWKITLLVNPIGIIVGIILIRKGVRYGLLLTILNIFLFISIGPMWFLGDLFNSLTGQ